MKKIYCILTLTLALSFSGIAQAPNKMSYQAVVRNASGALIANQQLGVKLSILENSGTGPSVYSETHSPSTNDNGLFTVEMGAGTKLTGDFATIDWSKAAYFIKTEIDSSGGNSYSITTSTQLLSVPYALHANSGGEWKSFNDGIFYKSGEVKIGNGADNTNSWNATLSVIGDTLADNPLLRFDQGGEGWKKGFYITSPASPKSGRIFLDNNVFSMGRSGTGLTDMLNFNSNGNVGISQTNPKSKLQVDDGDIYIEDINKGVIMKSPNGTCWRVTIDNLGGLVTTSITCP